MRLLRSAFLFGLTAVSIGAEAQEPSWTTSFDKPTAGPLGAYTHAVGDGEGGLYALGFHSADPHGLDLRIDRFGPDGSLSWSLPLPGDDTRDEVPLGLGVSTVGPCATYATPDGFDRVAAVLCAGADGSVRWRTTARGLDLGLDSFGLRGTFTSGTYPDGSVLVAAASTESPTDIAIVRLGASGAEDWRTAYRPPGNASSGGRRVAAAPVQDGGAVVAISGAGFARLDASGRVAWEIPPANGGYGEGSVALAVGPQGDIVVTGHDLTSGMYPQPITARFAADGTLRWATNSEYDELGLVAEIVAFTSTGLSIHAGASGGSLFVTAVDELGDVSWAGGYSPEEGGRYWRACLAAALPDSSGGVLLVGSATPGTYDEAARAVHVAALDSSGALRWGVRREVTGGPDVALAAALLDESRVAVAGGTTSDGGFVPEVALFNEGDEETRTKAQAVRRPRSDVIALEAVTGGALAFGTRPDTSGLPQLHVTRVDSTGTEVWSTPVSALSSPRFSATTDGGSVAAGQNSDGYAQVVQIGPEGTVRWEAVWVADNARPRAVVARPDGGTYVALTEGWSNGTDGVAVAIGPDGKTLWSDPLMNTFDAFQYPIIAAPLGDGVVVAVRDWAAALIKAYSPDGTVLWEHQSDEFATSIQATPAGGACYTGTATRCLRPDGSLAWEAPFRGSSIVVADDGAVTVAGDPEADGTRQPAPFRLAHYGPEGTLVWNAEVGSDLGHGPGYFSQRTILDAGDGFVFISAISAVNGYQDGAVILFDPNGAESWRYTVPASELEGRRVRWPEIALDDDRGLYVGTTQGGTVTYAPHPSPFYRAATYDVARVSRFDRSAIRYVVPNEDRPTTLSALSTPVPNPSSQTAKITVSVPTTGDHVQVEVLDPLGRRVDILVDSPLAAGVREIVIDVSRLPSGTYLVRARVADSVFVERLTVVR